MSKTLLTVISLYFLVGCSDNFPAEYAYHIDVNKKVCDEFTIDKDNIKIKFNKAIPMDQCPQIIGFETEKAGEVMAWARRMKEKLSECGQ